MNFGYTENLMPVASLLSLESEAAKPSISMDACLQISSFPQTRYYGSKRRLLDWIYLALKDIPFSTVLDGFGGTSSVSLLFKMMGKEVTFHDALMCNTISAYALLADVLPISSIEEAYLFIDGIVPHDGFISKTFSGMYYTDEENRWLDGAALAIHEIGSPELRSVYLHCLFQACLKKRPFNLFHRANLNLRLNRNVNRSFGNLVTWETPFSNLMKATLHDVSSTVAPSLRPVKIMSPGDVGRLTSGYDLVYLDPPYVSNGRRGEDYLKRYHFLEGFSHYDRWEAEINDASTIKALKPRLHMDEWQSKAIFREKLFNLIRVHRDSVVVLSYVAGAYPSAEEIEGHFRDNFHSVRVLKKEFSHALAKDKKVELLFIGSNE